MKVVVGMRAYNEPKILMRYSVESVLKQTHKDTHLIVYRDGGRKMDWLHEYVDRYPDRVEYIECEQNKGRAGAANAILSYVPDDADVITWLDADGEQMGPGAVEYAVSQVLIVGSKAFWFVRLARYITVWHEFNKPPSIRMASLFHEQFFGDGELVLNGEFKPDYYSEDPGLAGVLNGLFLPASVVRDIRFDEKYNFHEDAEWTIAVEKMAMERYGLWQPYGDVSTVNCWQPLEAVYFGFVPIDQHLKYEGFSKDSNYFNYNKYAGPSFGQKWKG